MMDNTNKAAWDTLNYGICACNAMSAKSVMMGYTKSAKGWAETGNGLEFMREAVRGGTFGYYETKPEPLPTADADQALSDILSVCDCCHGGCMARERIEALRGRLTSPLDTAEADAILDYCIRQTDSDGWEPVADRLRSLRSRLVLPPEPKAIPEADVHPSNHLAGLRAKIKKTIEEFGGDDYNNYTAALADVLTMIDALKADTRPLLDPEKLTDEQCKAIAATYVAPAISHQPALLGRHMARAVATVCRVPAPPPDPEDVPDELLGKALLAWETGRGGRTNSMRAAYRVFRDWLMGGAK